MTALAQQTTAHKGKISEAAFTLEAVIRGWDVIIPTASSDDYDRIIKRPNTRPIVVQVKRSHRDASKDRYYRINCSRSGCSKGDSKRILYSATAFDVLAAHLHDIDKWLFFTRAEIGNRTTALYVLPEERKQSPRHDAMQDRNPDNWSLLHDIAELLTFSGPTPADV